MYIGSILEYINTVHVHIHVHVHVHVHVCIHVQYVHVHVHMHAYIHVQLYTIIILYYTQHVYMYAVHVCSGRSRGIYEGDFRRSDILMGCEACIRK